MFRYFVINDKTFQGLTKCYIVIYTNQNRDLPCPLITGIANQNKHIII